MSRRGRVVVAALVALVLVGGVAWWAVTEPAAEADQRAGQRAGQDAVVRPRVAPRLQGRVAETIGVVSFNAWRMLEEPAARKDWDRITSDEDVDLIGWQEAKSAAWAGLYPAYRERGWDTWHWADPDGPRSVAFSWRTDTFRLLDVSFTRMHRGARPDRTDAPFPARWVVEASLRHRPTGLLVTLLDTHVNQTIETGHGWEDNLNARLARRHYVKLARLFAEAPGDVVIGTGDLNFDYADDAEYRPRGGISRTVARRALSSYAALGTAGVRPTYRTRWIDYVWLAHRSVRRGDGTGVAQFARHRSLGGYRSDHRPLLARIRLYGR